MVIGQDKQYWCRQTGGAYRRWSGTQKKKKTHL